MSRSWSSTFSKSVAVLLALIMLSPETTGASAVDLLVSGRDHGGGQKDILRYDGITGAFIGVFVPAGSGGLSDPHGLAFGSDGNLYVASSNNGRVLRYDGSTGAFVDAFVASGAGGLAAPDGVIFGPDGNLYVSSATGQVKRYHGTTGSFIDDFASGGGLVSPHGLVFGPDGNLYVSDSATHLVKRYHGTSGAFIDDFASGGGLNTPRGLAFGRDGHLYVSSWGTSSVLRYDGTTGAFIDAFVPSAAGGLDRPWGVGFGPDGHLYVSSQGTDSVMRYDSATGASLPGPGHPGAVFASIGRLGDPSYTYFVFRVQALVVAIDIKPGSFPNSINPKSKGEIPVAILTNGSFDATTVDSTTVRFGATGTEAAPVRAALEDVDGDGDTDMILHFNTQDTDIVCGDTSASLAGETFSGQPIEGSDSIITAGCE